MTRKRGLEACLQGRPTGRNVALATVAVVAALALPGCPTEDCGDGVADPNEQCDEGASNANQPNRCRVYCEIPICGDSIVDDAPEWDCEQCDGGAACQPDCRTTPISPTCGDGVVDVDEECDDGGMSNRDGCESNCTFTPAGCMM